MRRSRPWAAAAALALLLLLAAAQSRRLAERRRAGLPDAYAGYTADVPPALTFVIAGLGGFRGLLSEILWFRASRLQEEGRYLELVQLADWITMLDPHAAEAWAYNAWNLAYNVSVMMLRDEDRLRWVQNGIALLRDEGLRFNPREARLYRELAWLYQNKIGDALDSAHLAYKHDLAQTMAPLLNPDGTLADAPDNRARLAALRLDADRMAALQRRFGPLDWRLAESHALYWASQGVDYATGAERLLCRRGVYQPLIISVFRGRLAGDPAERRWRTEPNLDLARPAADYLAETLAETASANVRLVALRFLAMAAQSLAQASRDAEARALYDRLLATLPAHADRPTFDDVLKGWEPHDETR